MDSFCVKKILTIIMEQFLQSCEHFEAYPRNILEPEATRRKIKDYLDRLHDAKHYLFCDLPSNPSLRAEPLSAVDFMDVDRGRGEYCL